MLGHTTDLFGMLLKHFRKHRHVTQQQLAEALGVHRNTIGRWEEGSYLPESRTLVLDLARCLQLNEQETRQLLDASLLAPLPIWSVPYPRNPFFTGREELLSTIHTNLGRGQNSAFTRSYALYGLGGIGKTQLALEYAYRYAVEYTMICWIQAETLEQIQSSLLRDAQQVDLPMDADTDQQRSVRALQQWLEKHDQWLLIWDNLEDLDLLARFLPAVRQGALLITTRRQVLGTISQGIELAPLEEAMQLLLRRTKMLHTGGPNEMTCFLATTMPAEYAAAAELIALLGRLPLALDQAGAYIEETGCGLGGYLHRYQQHRLQLLDLRGTSGGNHPQSVATTFWLASERIGQQQNAAADLLHICAFLSADAIPEELFERGSAYFGPTLSSLGADPLRFDQVITVLRNLSLLQRQPETRTLSIHRLVQVVLLEHMHEAEQAVWLERILAALNALFPEVVPDTWKQCERLLPHVLACVSVFPAHASNHALAEMMQKAADYLRAQAQYVQAEPLYQRALSIWQHMVTSPPPQVAASLNKLANLYYDQGKYEQAESLYIRALDIREYALGEEHPEVATSLNNLAILFTEQEKYEMAEPLFQQALSTWERAWGPDHPHVAASLTNLALLCYHQGKYEQAEQYSQRALSIQERVLGPEHPDVNHALNSLADIYMRQGKYEHAEPLYQRALQIWIQALGSEHPLLAQALHGLANLSVEQRNEKQAKVLYQQALSLREREFGNQHIETAHILHDLQRLA
ncbi:FxSxx-COOH system tetratricopeptide repeat protein [Dictyobacter aurantiacus]|uniref:HTH cro/C1-type domain-containing protein n=1 Tax=Dictyobacter aurantiacus TaxID=1936993 RepID=A0A401ZT40_9CHLR|nr:FxSxx-COOH system tetratricopeptide repeat protein [Dictyobacter aurantiacus]GCE10045.1 hypothetical protein KDAU_73740 [Dictyobacter aurantiacus]